MTKHDLLWNGSSIAASTALASEVNTLTVHFSHHDASSLGTRYRRNFVSG
jgi:hypothetical protein